MDSLHTLWATTPFPVQMLWASSDLGISKSSLIQTQIQWKKASEISPRNPSNLSKSLQSTLP